MTLHSKNDCSIDLDTLMLERGAHTEEEHRYCLLEAAACVAGEPHTDRPRSVSTVIGNFGRVWQDDLDDAPRQMLTPYVLKVQDTNTGAVDEERRIWMVTDWLVRTYTPAWLDLATLTDHAASLRALPELSSSESALKAQPIINAARAAIGAAAAAGAGAAALAATGAAAGAAALAVTGAAAGAGAPALAATVIATGAAARVAAGAATGVVLQPTVVTLQASALDLLDRLIAVGKTPA